MLKVYTPPYLMLLLIINMMNMIFSTYFITLLFIGITFKILIDGIKDERNILILLSVFTFLIIENTQGLKIFSLTLSSIVIYLFIRPRLSNIFSSILLLDYICIFLLYVFFYFLSQSYVNLDVMYIFVFLLNLFIDILVVGLLL